MAQMDYVTTSSIDSFVDKIPNNSKVVFDWDNTLKITSADRKHINSGLSKESLTILAKDKHCSLYIISAIRPTRMNLDTLLFEVDKLGLRCHFCSKCQRENYSSEVCSHVLKPDVVNGKYTYVCWSNIVICAYDKAEVFLELVERERIINSQNDSYDEFDGLEEIDLNLDQNKLDKVYFFDDENLLHNRTNPNELKMADPVESMDDFIHDEEETIDDGAHEKLLNSIYALDGKKRHKNVVRGLPSTSSNVDLTVHSSTNKIQLKDLNVKSKHFETQLKKPLNEQEAEKARRQIARMNMVTEMTKWEPVVHNIRAAPQTIFSKRPHGIKMYEAVQPKSFTPRTPLEKEIFEALGKSEDVLRPDQEMTVAEARAVKAMSVKEAQLRRAELLKHHELLSRVELKAKWQNKIKSKRYRKIMRMDKVMAEKKLLEQLQKTDPEAFIDKLEQMEKARMEERLTLKHRGGGKFSRLHKAYSKFDDKTRDAVQDMLQKSREITKKRQHVSSSEDETSDKDEADYTYVANSDDEEDGTGTKEKSIARRQEILKAVNKKAGGWLDIPKTNPLNTQPESEPKADDIIVIDSIDGEVLSGASGKMDIPKTNLLNTQPESEPKADDIIVIDSIDGEVLSGASGKMDVVSEVITVENSCEESRVDSLIPADITVDLTGDSLSEPTTNSTATVNVTHSSPGNMVENVPSQESDEEESEGLDVSFSLQDIPQTQQNAANEPKKKKRRNKKKNSQDTAAEPKERPVKEITLQDVSGKTDGDSGDDEGEMRVTMEELFQDEDVLEEFAKEKAEAEERSRPKLEDTKLPGWGSWAGPDYKNNKQNERQKKKAIDKARRLQQQQQKIKQPNVWLNPNRDEAIRKLQPKTVPFPYTSVQQYEASLRQPVSRGFVRETAFKLLTKPEVVTKLGHIIKPADKDDYFKNKEIEVSNGFESTTDKSQARGKRTTKRQRRSIS